MRQPLGGLVTGGAGRKALFIIPEGLLHGSGQGLVLLNPERTRSYGLTLQGGAEILAEYQEECLNSKNDLAMERITEGSSEFSLPDAFKQRPDSSEII